MNENKIRKQARKFYQQDAAFIHVEMRTGEEPEMVLSGEGTAIFYCINRIIDKISWKSGVSSAEILDVIREMHEIDDQLGIPDNSTPVPFSEIYTMFYGGNQE